MLARYRKTTSIDTHAHTHTHTQALYLLVSSSSKHIPKEAEGHVHSSCAVLNDDRERSLPLPMLPLCSQSQHHENPAHNSAARTLGPTHLLLLIEPAKPPTHPRVRKPLRLRGRNGEGDSQRPGGTVESSAGLVPLTLLPSPQGLGFRV